MESGRASGGCQSWISLRSIQATVVSDQEERVLLLAVKQLQA